MRLQPSLAFAATVAAVAVAAPAAPAADLLSENDRSSFKRLQREVGGEIGLAVAPLGRGTRVQSLGPLTSAVAWSTSKVPVAMAVVAAGDGRSRAGDLRAAITASDNAAAERLFASLGSPATAARRATEQLRDSGDARTVIQSRRLRAGYTAFGQTLWTVRDQAAFAAGLRCTESGKAVSDLMKQTVPGQRWGLGAVDTGAALKGGWGPGSRPGVNGGSIDRQLGIIRKDGRRFAVAMISRPADGTHESGIRALTAIAKWTQKNVSRAALKDTVACG